jgi:hypothetical protein
LQNDVQSLVGTVQAAAGLYPELYRKHDEVCKRLTRVKVLRDEAKKKGRRRRKKKKGRRRKKKKKGRRRRKKKRRKRRKRREGYYDIVLKIEVDKQVDQLLDKQDQDLSDVEGADEGWNPSIPQYGFPERARIVEAFYGPGPKTPENYLAPARRIEVTKDLTARYGCSEPSHRGKRYNWTGMTTAMMNPSK